GSHCGSSEVVRPNCRARENKRTRFSLIRGIKKIELTWRCLQACSTVSVTSFGEREVMQPGYVTMARSSPWFRTRVTPVSRKPDLIICETSTPFDCNSRSEER